MKTVKSPVKRERAPYAYVEKSKQRNKTRKGGVGTGVVCSWYLCTVKGGTVVVLRTYILAYVLTRSFVSGLGIAVNAKSRPNT